MKLLTKKQTHHLLVGVVACAGLVSVFQNCAPSDTGGSSTSASAGSPGSSSVQGTNLATSEDTLTFTNGAKLPINVVSATAIDSLHSTVALINPDSGRIASVTVTVDPSTMLYAAVAPVQQPYLCYDSSKDPCGSVIVPAGYSNSGKEALNFSSDIYFSNSSQSLTGIVGGVTTGNDVLCKNIFTAGSDSLHFEDLKNNALGEIVPMPQSQMRLPGGGSPAIGIQLLNPVTGRSIVLHVGVDSSTGLFTGVSSDTQRPFMCHDSSLDQCAPYLVQPPYAGAGTYQPNCGSAIHVYNTSNSIDLNVGDQTAAACTAIDPTSGGSLVFQASSGTQVGIQSSIVNGDKSVTLGLLNSNTGRSGLAVVNVAEGNITSVSVPAGSQPYLCLDPTQDKCASVAVPTGYNYVNEGKSVQNCASPIFFTGVINGSVNGLRTPLDCSQAPTPTPTPLQ